MLFSTTDIEGVLIYEPKVFNDERGYFFESFRSSYFEELGITRPFIQDNQAFSTKGALRGLHYQTGSYAQAKLVRVLLGEVLDVVVDIRPESKTFGRHYKIILSGDNHKQLYVPRGFAHGYLVLSETAIFCYKCDNYYSKSHEGGLRFDDPNVGIDWGFPANELNVSEKDLILPTLGTHISIDQ